MITDEQLREHCPALLGDQQGNYDKTMHRKIVELKYIRDVRPVNDPLRMRGEYNFKKKSNGWSWRRFKAEYMKSGPPSYFYPGLGG